eukprot:7564667-Alexandrium_andersonii.AAC.1
MPGSPARTLHGRHGDRHQAAGAQHAGAGTTWHPGAAHAAPHARRALPGPALVAARPQCA